VEKVKRKAAKEDIKPQTVKEKDLHKQLVKLLRHKQTTQNFLFFHVKNDVGRRANGFFYDLKPMGVLPGVADFCILKEGETIFFEIKTSKGKLSDNQKIFLKNVQELGHKTYVAYGWDDILEKVKKIL
jgi:hypothetical protein